LANDDKAVRKLDNDVAEEAGVDQVAQLATRGAHGVANTGVARRDDGVEDVRVSARVEHRGELRGRVESG
jgi:uncharacterized protein with GYD domain